MSPHTLKFGSKAPEFDLPGVDGRRHSLREFKGKKAVAVIFSCNHHGTVDDSPYDASKVTQRHLADARASLLAGRPVAVPETKSVGCMIKLRGQRK